MNRKLYVFVVVAMAVSVATNVMLAMNCGRTASAQANVDVQAYWGTAYTPMVRLASSDPMTLLATVTEKLEEMRDSTAGTQAQQNAIHAAEAQFKTALLEASGAVVGQETTAPTFAEARAQTRALLREFLTDEEAIDAIMADVTASFLEHYEP